MRTLQNDIMVNSSREHNSSKLVPKNRVSKYFDRTKERDWLKGGIGIPKIIVGDFNVLLSIIDRSS